MKKFSFDNLPMLQTLEREQIKELYEDALYVLGQIGIRFEYQEALDILEAAGCTVDRDLQIVRFPEPLVTSCINSAPETFDLYDREGNFYCKFGDGTPRFNPGSSSVRVLDRDGRTSRSSRTSDLIAITKVAQTMPQIDFVSSSVVPEEAPLELGSQFIYFTEIKHSIKPIIGGSVDEAGPKRTFTMLKALLGSEDAVRNKPYTIFDICSVSPLSYSHIGAANIIDCARLDLPIELICASIAGVTGPVSLAGAVVQHTAEILAGLVLAQAVKPGHPVVYGGAPCTFNMKTTYTPMNSVEGDMIRCAYGLMGKYFGLPTHTYAGLSDAKMMDYQAGYETGRSALLAIQCGFDNMSGIGGLNVIAEMSPEKMVMDAEAIGLLKHWNKGISLDRGSRAVDVMEKVGPGGNFMMEKHTLNYFRKEYNYDCQVMNFMDRAPWVKEGAPEILEKSIDKVDQILEQAGDFLDDKREADLNAAFLEICREAGVSNGEELIRLSRGESPQTVSL